MIQTVVIAVKTLSEASRLAHATALLCPDPITVHVIHVIEDESPDGYLKGRDIGTEVLDHLRIRRIDASLGSSSTAATRSRTALHTRSGSGRRTLS